MKTANYLKGYLPWQSEFDHHYACWTTNHRGWAKMKKFNKKQAKKREKRNWRKEAVDGERQTQGLSGSEKL